MEYVIVTFPRQRQVFIDGELSGQTGDKLQVDSGLHTFNLGAQRDYKPKWRRKDVAGTTVLTPVIIEFDEA